MTEYESIHDEVVALPAILDESTLIEVVMWIFINRLLYGLDWGDKYEK